LAKSRHISDLISPVGVICHHTGGALTGNAGSLGTVIHGRAAVAASHGHPAQPALSGPLVQLLLARDGTFIVVAAGAAHHAGEGKWQGFTDGNGRFIGIEAENTGFTSGPMADPWPRVQMNSYRWGVAAILRKIGADPSMCCGHAEYALPKGRKSDPTFDMDQFRLDVDACMIIRTIGLPVRSPLQTAPGPSIPTSQYMHGRFVV
jgi:hypothetical protein